MSRRLSERDHVLAISSSASSICSRRQRLAIAGSPPGLLLTSLADGGRGLGGDGNDRLANIADCDEDIFHQTLPVAERDISPEQGRADDLPAVRADSCALIAFLEKWNFDRHVFCAFARE